MSAADATADGQSKDHTPHPKSHVKDIAGKLLHSDGHGGRALLKHKSTATVKDMADHEWAREYKPWRLLQVGGSLLGGQIAILFFLWYEVSPLSNRHHEILMNCRRDVLGWVVYPCEGSVAFARGFPLMAASMALIVTGRYILQFRIYFHFLLRSAIIDFTNHEIKKDLALIQTLVCFLLAVSAFILDLLFPPYVTMDKMMNITTAYFFPCIVFFLLWKNAQDVEWHLLPLSKFVEHDPQWAKGHIYACEKYLDTSIKHNFNPAQKKIYHEKPDHTFELDDLLDEIITISRPANSHWREEPDHGDIKHGVHSIHDFHGLWPGHILLNPHLKDAESKRFRNAFMAFVAMFLVLQLGILAALTMSAVLKANDAQSRGIPHDAFYVGGRAFEQLGQSGYCRAEGQHRPPGYFIKIEDLDDQHDGTNVALLPQTAFRHVKKSHAQVDINVVEKERNLCAHECAANEYCNGFALDPDLCSIYLSKEMEAPSGWSTLRSIHRMSKVEDLLNKAIAKKKDFTWDIVTTDGSTRAVCFTLLTEQAEPQKYVACAVYVCLILVILRTLVMVGHYTFKSYHMHPDDPVS